MIDKEKIEVIVWDVDGTLYKSDATIHHVFEEMRRKLLEKYWQRPYEGELKNLFLEFKERYKSTTQTLAVLTGLSLSEVTEKVESRLRKERHLSTDPRLVRMFRRFSHLTHLALRNGGREETLHILEQLGLNEVRVDDHYQLGPFLKVWGSIDDFYLTKPCPGVFDRVKLWIYKNLFYQPGEKVTSQTIDQIAAQVLMVGDKPEVDLKPAKEVGFQTALAWSDLSSSKLPDYVDVALPTVYDLERVLDLRARLGKPGSV